MHLRRIFNIIIATCILFALVFCEPLNALAKENELTTVTVAYLYDDEYFGGKYDNDVKYGYAYDYLQALANFAGWKYKYVYGDYDALLEQFMQGKIDIMPLVSRDFDAAGYYENKLAEAKDKSSKDFIEENRIQVLFTNQPMNSSEYYLCISAESGDDFSISSLYGGKIGVPEEIEKEAKEWLSDIGLSTCKISKYQNSAAAINALNKGDVAAIIAQNGACDESLITYRKLGSIDYYLTVSNKNPILLKEANAALDAINETSKNFINTIKNSNALCDSISEKLSDGEKDWIKSHPKVKVGLLKDYMPISGCNDETIEALGYGSYVIGELLDSLMVNSELEYSFYETYSELVSALLGGEIDIMFPSAAYLYDSECEEYMYTAPLIGEKMYLLYKGELNDNSYSSIGYLSESLTEKFVKNNFPNAQHVGNSDLNDIVQSCLKEDISAAVVTEYDIDYIDFNTITNRKLHRVLLPNELEISVGVKRGNTALFQLINRAMSVCDASFLEQEYLNMVANNYKPDISIASKLFKLEIIIVAVAFLVLIVIILMLINSIKKAQATSKKLKKANKEIKEIAEHQQHNFDVIGILTRDYLSVYKVNLFTELVEVYRLEENGEGKYGDLLRMGNRFSEVFNEYVREKVFEDDKQKMYDEVSLPVIKKKLKQRKSYAIRFRMINGTDETPRYYEMRISVAETDDDGKVTDIIIGFVDCNDEILHELEYMKSLEKTLKSDAVITGLAGDFEWIAYVGISDKADSTTDVVTHYRISDTFKNKFENFKYEKSFANTIELLANGFVAKADRNRFIKESKTKTVIRHFSKDSMYFVNFKIINDKNEVEYYQLKFVEDVVDGKRFGFIVGCHSVDEELKKEKEQQEKLERMVSERTIQLEEKNNSLNRMNNDIIELMGNVVEGRDVESGEHVRRVKGFTRILALQVMKDLPEYNLTPEKVDVITSASALHDVGKITIPDNILLKPGRLNDEEFKIMQSHTVNGCTLLKSMPSDWGKEYLEASLEICRHHHEKYDGKGYPDKLVGDQIPISAQIVSIADCYDALVSKRVYKDAYTCDQAFNMISNGECGVFSSKLLACFAKCKDSFAEQVKVTTQNEK